MAYVVSVTVGPTWFQGILVPNWLIAVTLAYALSGMIPYTFFWVIFGGLMLEFTLPTPPLFFFLLLGVLTMLLLFYRRRTPEYISFVALVSLVGAAGLTSAVSQALMLTHRVTLDVLWVGLVESGAIFISYFLIRSVTNRFRLRTQDSTLKV